MHCEEVKRQFADYVSGSLPRAELAEFEAHQMRCSACREEIAELQELWRQMGHVRARAMDSERMDGQFDTMITAFKDGVDPAGVSPARERSERIRAWFSPFGSWRLAAAMGLILLAAGSAWFSLRDTRVAPIKGQAAKEPSGKTAETASSQNAGIRNEGNKGTEGTGAGMAGIAGNVAHSEPGGPTLQKVGLRLGVADLGGPERYLTHITTDKPIYRTGEKVYIRGVVLRADDHSPLPNTTGGFASFEIKGPKGETVTSGLSPTTDSTTAFTWDVPENQAGGQYTVRITQPVTGDAPAERKFDIRAYRAPRLKTQIVFLRDGYGPGDAVSATLSVERAEGGVPAGAKVSMVARVDGVEAWKGETTVDASGNASARFKLPAVIARGEGVLAMTIDDGAGETATKTIPIILRTLDLAIYPEGGDLVAGLANRVYIEGQTINQKPADIAGIVVNRAGQSVAAFRTEHEGRGRFTFTPIKGESYSLRVTEPAGIKTVFPLPAVRESGVVLTATSNVIAREIGVSVRVAATSSGVYGVALSQRGKEIALARVALQAGTPADVTLAVPTSQRLDGVVTVTVSDSHMTPMAERLLFRQPDRRLKVQVTADRSDYVPGDKVTLRVATTDDTGKPVGAVVGLTVTDSSVLEMIDKREQAPQLPVMALLENDVRSLSDAHVYLDENNPKAALATDLILGTQGWRRFATVDLTKFVTTNGDAARRALAIRTAPARNDELLAMFSGRVEFYGGQNLRQNALNALVADIEAGRGTVGRLTEQLFVFAGDGGFRLVPPVVVADQLRRANDDQALFRFFDGWVDADFQRRLADRELLVAYVREYAHALRPDWKEGSRSDFAETVYWNAGLKTDASSGIATVSFSLNDSVTSFRVLADGFTGNGALGASVTSVESVRPFYIEPKIPLQVTIGDVIQLPIGVVSGLNRDLDGVKIDIKATEGIKAGLSGGALATLGPKQRTRQLAAIEVGGAPTSKAEVTIEASAGGYRDTVVRKLDVQPMGFPGEAAAGGMLEPNITHSLEFSLPAETIRGSVASKVLVYPTPLASMTEALQALLRQPNGCFEQTSSTSYPMVMAQQYFLTHVGVAPAIIETAKGYLDASYKKLTGFESRSRGYEWFGADPGHEALTAYGLMQFTDMAQIRDVDKAMVQRTREWLLGRRDGNGGYSRNARALDSFGGAPPETTNAYITWALVESGEKGLAREIATIKSLANASEDSYLVALAANILHASGDRAGARQLMEKLVKAQDSAGYVRGAANSITRSGGDSLAIEATALSTLAWMREPAYAANVEKSIWWIAESNKNGRFGSTQSTILALRAIIAYDAARSRAKAPGRVVLMMDGKAVGAPVAFTTDTPGPIVLPEFGHDLAPGRHTLALKMEDGSNMPFSVSVTYSSVRPDNSEKAQIGIQVTLKNRQVQEGGVTEATVSIANKSNEAIPTPVAIVGIPGGLEVRHDQLKELVKSGQIAAYEVIGREVILYWRYLKGNDQLDVPLSLAAAVPGVYTGPASRVYLYYTDEFKNWAPALKVTITPRDSRQ